jgi:hypothetical protein
MRWRTKEKANKEDGRQQDGTGVAGKGDRERAGRIEKLKADLQDLCGGESVFALSPQSPQGMEEADLEDILAFESVGTGISLFEGLEMNGTELPPPDKMNELQSQRKVMEIFRALEELRIFLIGFEDMTGRELYSLLWHRTLWEGCYIRKRNPFAITLIDVSHRIPRSEMRRFLESLTKAESVQ